MKPETTMYTRISELKIANKSLKFTTSLAKVANSSFERGIFSTSFKTANVVFIYKEILNTEDPITDRFCYPRRSLDDTFR